MKRPVQKSKIVEAIFNMITGDIIAWLTFVMMMLVLVEVIARYFFNSPFGVADELGAYMFVTISLVGAAYTWKVKGHIRVEAVVSRLPPKVRSRLRLATLILATAFVPLLIKGYYDLVIHSYLYGLRSEHWMRLPLVWPRLTMLIGVVLLFIIMIVDLVKRIKSIKTSGW